MNQQPRKAIIAQTATLLLLGGMFLPLQGAGRQKIKISVSDEREGDGIQSSVILLKGDQQKFPVGVTNRHGRLEIRHECALGERFYAVPIDGSFFHSNEGACRKEVVLLVVKRETPEGVLVKRETRTVRVWFRDGSYAAYVISWNGRVSEKYDASFSGPTIRGPHINIHVNAESSLNLVLTRYSSSGGLSDLTATTVQSTSSGGSVVDTFAVGWPKEEAEVDEAVANLKKETVLKIEKLAEDESGRTEIIKLILKPEDREKVIHLEISKQD